MEQKEDDYILAHCLGGSMKVFVGIVAGARESIRRDPRRERNGRKEGRTGESES